MMSTSTTLPQYTGTKGYQTLVTSKGITTSKNPTLPTSGFNIDLIWGNTFSTTAPSIPKSAISPVQTIINAAKQFTKWFENPVTIYIDVTSTSGTGGSSYGQVHNFYTRGNISISNLQTYIKNAEGTSPITQQKDAIASINSHNYGNNQYQIVTSLADIYGLAPGTSASSTDGTLYLPSNPNQAEVEYLISRILGRVDNFGDSKLGDGTNYTPFDLFHYVNNKGKYQLFYPGWIEKASSFIYGSGYFSVDGGITNLGTFTRSTDNLGHWYAADWADGAGTGHARPQDVGRHTTPLYPWFTPEDLLADAVLGYQLTASGKTAIGTLGLDAYEIANPGKLK